MKGKKMRIAAWLLAVAVLAADFGGNVSAVSAAQEAVTADDARQQELPEMEQAFLAMLQEYEMYGTLVGSEIAVYQHPSVTAPVVQKLFSGYQVRFLGAAMGTEGLWYQVAFGVSGREYTGFIQENVVVTQDERLQEWKRQYFGSGKSRSAAGTNAVAMGSTDLSAFPNSYRSYIKKLIAAHPNWTFVPMNTGLKWSDVIENEMKDAVNLVDINTPATWKSTAEKDYNMSTGAWVIKNGTTWVQASESVVKYYIDPRNSLNEESVFQFEQLTYNQSYHTEAGVEKILSGTFMANKKLEDGSGGNITYAKAFMKIGKELKVSPYFLASRVRQEQGVNGTSKLISGTYPGYKGYYNYFNIQATGIGEQVIISGLQEAKKAGWTTRYAALYGGAAKTAENYISKGQDTFYLQKFDVDASYNGLYWHQYMQNLLAANNESKNVRNSYTSMGVINNNFVFKVPVYQNMPSKACPYPGEKLSKPSLAAEKTESGTVKLSWNEIGGAAGYALYRKEGKDGKYVRIKKLNGLTKTSYHDKTVLPGVTYEYKVRAFLKLSSGYQRSAYSAVKAVDFTVPSTQWNKFAVSNYTTVQLSWKKVGITGYRIYRKTDSGKYTCIKDIGSNQTVSYKDTNVVPGHTYTYRIRCYQTVNGKKYYSPYTSVMAADIKMSAPRLKSASVNDSAKIKLTWQKDTQATGYYIYRSTAQKGGYKKVKTITKNTSSGWTDSSVAPGKTYYYKIKSYVEGSAGKGTSAYSRALMVQMKAKSPAIAQVSSSAGGIKLKWTKDAKAAGYQISRSTDLNGKYEVLKNVTGNSTVTFTDKKAALGQTYYYKVRTYRTSKKKTIYSSWSAAAGGQAKMTETQLVGVSGVKSKSVTLKWQKVVGAGGYKLYRKAGKNGKYSEVQSISGANATSVTDRGLKAKTTYYYKMRAYKKVNGKARYSAYSGEWCVKTV